MLKAILNNIRITHAALVAMVLVVIFVALFDFGPDRTSICPSSAALKPIASGRLARVLGDYSSLHHISPLDKVFLKRQVSVRNFRRQGPYRRSLKS